MARGKTPKNEIKFSQDRFEAFQESFKNSGFDIGKWLKEIWKKIQNSKESFGNIGKKDIKRQSFLDELKGNKEFQKLPFKKKEAIKKAMLTILENLPQEKNAIVGKTQSQLASLRNSLHSEARTTSKVSLNYQT